MFDEQMDEETFVRHLELVEEQRDKTTVKGYGDLDTEIVNLVVALNKIKSVRTIESCFGHGKHDVMIWLKVSSINHFNRFIQCIPRLDSPHTKWHMVLDNPDINFYSKEIEVTLKGDCGATKDDCDEFAERIERIAKKQSTWYILTQWLKGKHIPPYKWMYDCQRFFEFNIWNKITPYDWRFVHRARKKGIMPYELIRLNYAELNYYDEKGKLFCVPREAMLEEIRTMRDRLGVENVPEPWRKEPLAWKGLY